MEKMKNFFNTLQNFWEFIWKYISHPIKEVGKLNEEINSLRGDIAISDENQRIIEQELSTWNENTYMDYFTHTGMGYTEDMNKTHSDIEFNSNMDEKHSQPDYSDIPDWRGISKSSNLATGNNSYILNGVKFPEESLTFTHEHRNIDGKDITIVNASFNGELSISLDGNILLDGQPLEMNQNVKNRLAGQIKELNGQNAKLNFDNGEFSILPRVQSKNSEVVAEKNEPNKPHNIREEMAMSQEERDRLAMLAKESADKIKEEHATPSPETIKTGNLVNEI